MRKSLTTLFLMFVLALSSFTVFAADAPTATSAAASSVININTADASQFAYLPRVGAKAGERIVEYRKANGAFKKTSDLMQVKGIGEKTFELIRPYLALDGKTTLSAKVHGPKKPRAARAHADKASSPTAQ